jgi:hypothetical protein
MKKIHLIRFVGVIVLCLLSSLIKSEDKGCSTLCILSAVELDQPKHITTETAIENTDQLTYYGFYSKF